MRSATKIGLTALILIVGLSGVCSAQQEAQFSQYMFNRMYYNPAYAGSSGSICATAMYRNQWMGLRLDAPAPGYKSGSAPVNYLFSFDLPVKFLHGGLGATVVSDQIGYHKSINVNVDYAFRIYWGPGNLAAAAEVNLYNNTLDGSQLIGSSAQTGIPSSPTDPSITDPLITASEESDFLIDMSTGLYYQIPGSMYVGVSVKNLLASKSDVLNYQNARSVYMMGGYEYTLPFNPSFRLKPSALVKTADFSVFQADVSCLLSYQNAVWGGASYRVNDAFAFMGGINWKKLQFGVAYDLTTSRIGGAFKRGRSQGTVELYLKYCFKVIIPQKAPSIYRNTRYLL